MQRGWILPLNNLANPQTKVSNLGTICEGSSEWFLGKLEILQNYVKDFLYKHQQNLILFFFKSNECRQSLITKNFSAEVKVKLIRFEGYNKNFVCGFSCQFYSRYKDVWTQNQVIFTQMLSGTKIEFWTMWSKHQSESFFFIMTSYLNITWTNFPNPQMNFFQSMTSLRKWQLFIWRLQNFLWTRFFIKRNPNINQYLKLVKIALWFFLVSREICFTWFKIVPFVPDNILMNMSLWNHTALNLRRHDENEAFSCIRGLTWISQYFRVMIPKLWMRRI